MRVMFQGCRTLLISTLTLIAALLPAFCTERFDHYLIKITVDETGSESMTFLSRFTDDKPGVERHRQRFDAGDLRVEGLDLSNHSFDLVTATNPQNIYFDDWDGHNLKDGRIITPAETIMEVIVPQNLGIQKLRFRHAEDPSAKILHSKLPVILDLKP